MIPVDQTTFGFPGGNCFSACVASILELTVADVPYFMAPDPLCDCTEGELCGCWWPGFLNWCWERGIECVYQKSVDGVPPGLSIMGGPNKTAGLGHAVVGLDGAMVHDPNPNRRGLREVEEYFILERLSVYRALELYAALAGHVETRRPSGHVMRESGYP